MGYNAKVRQDFLDEGLQRIADAIRDKRGLSANTKLEFPDDFIAQLRLLPDPITTMNFTVNWVTYTVPLDSTWAQACEVNADLANLFADWFSFGDDGYMGHIMEGEYPLECLASSAGYRQKWSDKIIEDDDYEVVLWSDAIGG